MKGVRGWLRALTVTVCLCAAWSAVAAEAAGGCEAESSETSAGNTARRFLVLAASRSVFYDQSGPSFVMLMKMNAGQAEMGAVGIYPDEEGHAVFGAVPWQTYDAFLREPRKSDKNAQRVMLRLEIDEPQYQRVLGILRSWARRAHEGELLYRDDVYMNNILLVKQATEALNRCRRTIDIYRLDWGINDRISDDNPPSHVPFLVFQELKRRNASLHVPDSAMPAQLLTLAGQKPLPAQEPTPARTRASPPAHTHHHGHEPAGALH